MGWSLKGNSVLWGRNLIPCAGKGHSNSVGHQTEAGTPLPVPEQVHGVPA